MGIRQWGCEIRCRCGRKKLGPGADGAEPRCGSDWLQRAQSSDVALPALPAVRFQPSMQPGAASGRGARCPRADLAGVSPYGSHAEIGRKDLAPGAEMAAE